MRAPGFATGLAGPEGPEPHSGLGASRGIPDAIISPCGTYRYRLDRPDVFGDHATAVIMVNPSTADATSDDATIRKLIGFRNRYGWGNLIVGNLFAYRATDVRELASAADPIGPDNGYRLAEIFLDADQVVFAWGPTSKLPKRLRERWQEVDRLARAMHLQPMSIGAPAKDGQPCHPLMLPYERTLQPWPAQGGVTEGRDGEAGTGSEASSTRSSEAGCALSPSNPSSPTTTKRG